MIFSIIPVQIIHIENHFAYEFSAIAAGYRTYFCYLFAFSFAFYTIQLKHNKYDILNTKIQYTISYAAGFSCIVHKAKVNANK